MDKAAEVCDFAKKLEFNVDLVPPNVQEQMERITNVSSYIKDQFRLTVSLRCLGSKWREKNWKPWMDIIVSTIHAIKWIFYLYILLIHIQNDSLRVIFNEESKKCIPEE